MSKKGNYRHGEAIGNKKTPEYRVWRHIRQRCYNPNDHKYPSYGGRGIRVCDDWNNSYKSFLSDMGRRPSLEYTIHRIDNDGDYNPTNCKWATAKEQATNRRIRSDNQTGYPGISILPSGRFRVVRCRVHKGCFGTLSEAIQAAGYEEDKKRDSEESL